MAGDTKKRSAEIALELFSKNGYPGTSMSDIAKQLGITKTALYKHYTSKHEILECIVERMKKTDYARAEEYDMPESEPDGFADDYMNTSAEKIREYSIAQFRYWTEEEFQSWLRTHRAVISKEYTTVAWTYKEVEHHCSPAEYDALNAPEDIFLMNGSKRRCKRIYDDDNYIMHTYFVWYWEHDLTKYAEENTVIESYTVDYFKNEVNSIALEEVHSGKIKPLKIDFE